MSLFEVTLHDGTVIECDQLCQHETYDDDIRASNFEFKNRFVLDGLEFSATHHFGDRPVFVVEPKRLRNQDGSEQFPAMICLGKFRSFIMDQSSPFDYLVLSIVWFQDTLFQELDPEIKEKIRAIDWHNLAAGAIS